MSFSSGYGASIAIQALFSHFDFYIYVQYAHKRRMKRLIVGSQRYCFTTRFAGFIPANIRQCIQYTIVCTVRCTVCIMDNNLSNLCRYPEVASSLKGQ
jgi:hypothetical protein